MKDATDDDAAMSMFRLERHPTIAQFQSSGRIPRHPPPLQTDKRECIEHCETRACQEHCALAFQALIDHLSNKTLRRNDSQLKQSDTCPFFVRWEIPKFSKSEIDTINSEDEENKLKNQVIFDIHTKKQEDIDANQEQIQLHNNDDEELDSDIVRWPRNPTSWDKTDLEMLKKQGSHIEPEFKIHSISHDAWMHEKENNHEDPAVQALEEQDNDVKEFLNNILKSSSKSSSKSSTSITNQQEQKLKENGINSINHHGEILEEIEMDPLYDWVKSFEENNCEDALWSTYFPTTQNVKRFRKVHPMNDISNPFEKKKEEIVQNKKKKSKSLSSSHKKHFLFFCFPTFLLNKNEKQINKKKTILNRKSVNIKQIMDNNRLLRIEALNKQKKENAGPRKVRKGIFNPTDMKLEGVVLSDNDVNDGGEQQRNPNPNPNKEYSDDQERIAPEDGNNDVLYFDNPNNNNNNNNNNDDDDIDANHHNNDINEKPSWRDELSDLFQHDNFDDPDEENQWNQFYDEVGGQDEDDDNLSDYSSDEDDWINGNQLSKLNQGEEKMTDASYELRGLSGSLLPCSIHKSVGEIGLWAASKDPSFLPISCGDVLGLPPHTSAFEAVKPANLFVSREQRRRHASVLRKVTRKAKRKVLRREKKFQLEKKLQQEEQNEKKITCMDNFKNKFKISNHIFYQNQKNNSNRRISKRGSIMGRKNNRKSFSLGLMTKKNKKVNNNNDGNNNEDDEDDEVEAMIAEATAKARARIQELPIEIDVKKGGARVSVILLGVFEMTDSAMDFDPGLHGVFGSFPHPTTGVEYRGVILPPLPERRKREAMTPAPPFWIEGDPTALEGYALNRRHVLKRLAQNAGLLGPCTDALCRSMKTVRFQIIDHAQMTFDEFRAYRHNIEFQEEESFGQKFPSWEQKGKRIKRKTSKKVIISDITDDDDKKAIDINASSTLVSLFSNNNEENEEDNEEEKILHEHDDDGVLEGGFLKHHSRSSVSAPGSNIPKQINKFHHQDISHYNEESIHQKKKIVKNHDRRRGSFDGKSLFESEQPELGSSFSKKSSPKPASILSDVFPTKTDAIRSTNTAPGRARQPLGIPLRPQVFSDD